MNRSKYRNKWLKWHASYEKRALKLIRTMFKQQVGRIDWPAMTPTNYEQIIRDSGDSEATLNALVTIH
jgi:hypothetical protein